MNWDTPSTSSNCRGSFSRSSLVAQMISPSPLSNLTPSHWQFTASRYFISGGTSRWELIVLTFSTRIHPSFETGHQYPTKVVVLGQTKGNILFQINTAHYKRTLTSVASLKCRADISRSPRAQHLGSPPTAPSRGNVPKVRFPGSAPKLGLVETSPWPRSVDASPQGDRPLSILNITASDPSATLQGDISEVPQKDDPLDGKEEFFKFVEAVWSDLQTGDTKENFVRS
ncbi:hypothetical protein PAXRUDRAFT_239366 [Paxillus rubicundulus Ve08.2h10]|uniref:Uncharacterized protein n=1 Tax=Paxillus rubicundulus Ve08.2h10 TaxID=930991 RepID=A0A0D0EBA7_9AGAM|nr:hypothetical protein PAXRUDRAFT_239366 [Paxillus rubicundulus Ve08.2h10]